ncbi:hypothetical protein ACP275_11G022600 [Erythranthe tilingii]
MGRPPPSCDKVVIKKGPWTPEEDIVLVSYIQEHGPGNWFAVPTNTGLLRCSKSCRLRWTNYLKPGIKRGNFTQHEEGMIIHLQALFGNKWAAIASYLPQRTDNDIKNYWNTHLKKKLKKIQAQSPPLIPQVAYDSTKSRNHSDLKITENSSVYASSSQNMSSLLQEWNNTSTTCDLDRNIRNIGKIPTEFSDDYSTLLQYYRPQQQQLDCNILSKDRSFIEEKSSCDSSQKGSDHQSSGPITDQEKIDDNPPPLSFLDEWLLDASASQVEDMEIPQIF